MSEFLPTIKVGRRSGRFVLTDSEDSWRGVIEYALFAVIVNAIAWPMLPGVAAPRTIPTFPSSRPMLVLPAPTNILQRRRAQPPM